MSVPEIAERPHPHKSVRDACLSSAEEAFRSRFCNEPRHSRQKNQFLPSVNSQNMARVPMVQQADISVASPCTSYYPCTRARDAERIRGERGSRVASDEER